MPWRLSSIFFAFLCLNGFIFANGQNGPSPNDRWAQWHAISNSNRNPNIKFDEPSLTGAGSGDGYVPYSDDEDFGESGSGSGSGHGGIDVDSNPGFETPRMSYTTLMPTTTTTSTSSRPQTMCETLRQTSMNVVGRFVPVCLENGDFAALQCHGHPGTSECYCVDLEGREIPGTLMEAPNFPRCDSGENLPPCVHQLVLNIRARSLLGTFRPSCAVDGQFRPVQCHGAMCFCVDEDTGKKIPSTEVHKPDIPNCDGEMPKNTTETTTKLIVIPPNVGSEDKTGDFDIDGKEVDYVPRKGQPSPDDTIEVDGNDKKEEETDSNDKFGEDDNRTDLGGEGETAESGQEGHQKDKVEKASEIMTQPGILAGIIGGSVVLLLCLVLLIMFIIYRMRKKDEGSYPLDEPRRAPNYNYVRAPEREFYA